QLGELPIGAIEEVRTRTLREQLGARVAARAGADFAGPRLEREASQPPVSKGVVPAKAGTRTPERVVTGPRNGVPATRASRGASRGDDGKKRNRLPPKPGVKQERRRRGDPDRIGPTELARREKRRGRRPVRDQRR